MNESSDLPQSHAEATDPSTLGENVGQDVRPGDDSPLDEPLGVDDPNIRSDGTIAPDDLATRAARETDRAGGRAPGVIDRDVTAAPTTRDSSVGEG